MIRLSDIIFNHDALKLMFFACWKAFLMPNCPLIAKFGFLMIGVNLLSNIFKLLQFDPKAWDKFLS